jgi:hypothetical protein
MQRLQRLLVPQRMDAVVLLCCYFGLSACAFMFLIDLEQYYVSVVALLVASLVMFSLGAAAGLKQFCWPRALIVFIAMALASAAAGYSDDGRLTYSYSYYYQLGSLRRFVFFDLWKQWLVLPLVGLAALLVTFLVRWMLNRLHLASLKLKHVPNLRTRCLIGLAVVMFIVHQIIQFGNFERNPIIAVLSILLPVTLAYFISDSFTGTWNWFKVLASLLLVGVISVGLVLEMDSLLPASFFVGGLLLSLLAVGSGVSAPRPYRVVPPNKDQTSGATCKPNWARISLWSAVPILLAAGLYVLQWFLHVPTLIDANSQVPFWQRFEEARGVADFARITQSKYSRDHYQNFGTFEFDFSRHSSSMALQKLDKFFGDSENQPTPWRPVLRNLHPGVQTKMKNFNGLAVFIDGGTITEKQLKDILDFSGFLFIQNLNVEASQPVKLKSRQIYLTQMTGEQVTKLFRAIDPESSINNIFIQSGVSAENWPAIAEASLQFPISCIVDDNQTEWKSFPKSPAKQIIVRFISSPTDAELLSSPAFCDSNISLSGPIFRNGRLSLSLLELKLLLRGLDVGYLAGPAEFYSSVTDWQDNQVFVFERDENGKPLALLCPLPITDDNFPTQGLEKLKTLTLDLGWVEPNYWNFATGWKRVEFPADKMAELSSLERLVLPADLWLSDLKFLKSLPNLKSLQTPSINLETDEEFFIDSLNQLEELTLFDDPTNELLQALAKLPKLNQLTIVLSDSFGGTTELREAIKKSLPNCEIAVYHGSKFQPIVPESFRIHFARVIEDLKEIVASSSKRNEGNGNTRNSPAQAIAQ